MSARPYEPADDAELDDILGPPAESWSARRSAPATRPRLVVEEPAPLPDAHALAEEQVIAASQRLFDDASEFPAFPFRALDAITGPMAPEDLWIVAGRTGGGKSLFMMNTLDALVADGRTVLYIGLEQSPKILRAKWSCLRTGVAPSLVLKPRREQYGTPEHLAARTRVLEDMRDYQRSAEIRARAVFCATRFVDRASLEHWTRGAVDQYGAQLVIVDHIDRMSHGDGRNAFHELSETVRLAKELAVRHQITMLVASQVGRPHDKIERFTPPALHELRGGGTKEEEADEVLTVYQPLREMPAKQLAAKIQAVKMGQCEDHELFQPGMMAVRELKNRIDGAVRGRQCLLGVERGRIVDLAPRDQYRTVDAHGMRRTP